MDVRNLRTFIKVSELNNFTKAASVLGYSQSAVTVQMQQLENEVGLPLFDRIGKNIRLTQYGIAFIDYARKVIEAMEEVENFARDSKDLHGVVRFGIVDSIMNACFIPIFTELSRRYPNVDINVFVGSAREIEAKIRANEIDLAYLLDYKVPKKEWIRIREEIEPIIFVTNPDNPIADREELSFEDIVNQKIILMPQGEGYRYLFDDELAKRNLFVTPALEIASTQTTIRLVKADNYIAMLPIFVAREHIRSGALKQVKVKNSDMYQWSQLVYLKGKAITPLLQAFIDTVLEMLPPYKDSPSEL